MPENTRAILSRMSASLRHRGPDGEGVWIDGSAGISHRRLSIIDLSDSGGQPMVSACGRFVLAFNGEIYNHQELRIQLQYPWRGTSDTETLLAAISAWGLEPALCRSVGMFALGLWDRQDKRLYLARDRMGEKPLYYGWVSGRFVFGSELKAFNAMPGFDNRIDRNALSLFMKHGFLPAPHAIYEKVFKLIPGTILSVGLEGSVGEPAGFDGDLHDSSGLRITRWWSLRHAAGSGKAATIEDPATAESALERAIDRAVKEQMISDVPLGAFLSGGIDSSLIVALMQKNSAVPINTYTIGFNEALYDEAGFADAVASHLGTRHTALYVSPADAMATIGSMPHMYDEPFADSSQIPTYLVSKLARSEVTVALSGDGGDELFGGYSRYLTVPTLWKILAGMPSECRRWMSGTFSKLPPNLTKDIGHVMTSVFPRMAHRDGLHVRLHRLSEQMQATCGEDLHANLLTEWRQSEDIVIGAGRLETVLSTRNGVPCFDRLEDRMMYMDAVFYLPDDILAKVDRAAMGASLETRAPFLDHRVVELAWQIPLSMKIGRSKGKQILRKILYKYVPSELIERPKQGFCVPVGRWLRGPLREWAEALLSEARLRQQGLLVVPAVRRKWEEHLKGERNWEQALWSVLMFQAWLDCARPMLAVESRALAESCSTTDGP